MTHAEIVDYTVAPFSWLEKKGAHEWMIEFKRLQNAFTLSKILDDTLQNLNSDYKQNVTITRPWIR
jgi:ABC-type Na+ transport system ATPase subunit NatA